MLRQSLMAAAFALATTTSTLPAGAQTNTHSTQHRTIVHHVYTYEPAPNLYYSPYYGPTYPTVYAPAAPVTALPGAAVCLAFSLIGGC